MSVGISKVSTIVKEFADEVRQVLSVYKVVLYGSYAKGVFTKYSDVDVCFFLNSYGDNDRCEIMLKLLEMSHKYTEVFIEPMAFEISDIYDDNPFVKEILRTGIEIL